MECLAPLHCTSNHQTPQLPELKVTQSTFELPVSNHAREPLENSTSGVCWGGADAWNSTLGEIRTRAWEKAGIKTQKVVGGPSHRYNPRTGLAWNLLRDFCHCAIGFKLQLEALLGAMHMFSAHRKTHPQPRVSSSTWSTSGYVPKAKQREQVTE